MNTYHQLDEPIKKSINGKDWEIFAMYTDDKNRPVVYCASSTNGRGLTEYADFTPVEVGKL